MPPKKRADTKEPKGSKDDKRQVKERTDDEYKISPRFHNLFYEKTKEEATTDPERHTIDQVFKTSANHEEFVNNVFSESNLEWFLEKYEDLFQDTKNAMKILAMKKDNPAPVKQEYMPTDNNNHSLQVNFDQQSHNQFPGYNQQNPGSIYGQMKPGYSGQEQYAQGYPRDQPGYNQSIPPSQMPYPQPIPNQFQQIPSQPQFHPQMPGPVPNQMYAQMPAQVPVQFQNQGPHGQPLMQTQISPRVQNPALQQQHSQQSARERVKQENTGQEHPLAERGNPERDRQKEANREKERDRIAEEEQQQQRKRDDAEKASNREKSQKEMRDREKEKEREREEKAAMKDVTQPSDFENNHSLRQRLSTMIPLNDAHIINIMNNKLNKKATEGFYHGLYLASLDYVKNLLDDLRGISEMESDATDMKNYMKVASAPSAMEIESVKLSLIGGESNGEPKGPRAPQYLVKYSYLPEDQKEIEKIDDREQKDLEDKYTLSKDDEDDKGNKKGKKEMTEEDEIIKFLFKARKEKTQDNEVSKRMQETNNVLNRFMSKKSINSSSLNANMNDGAGQKEQQKRKGGAQRKISMKHMIYYLETSALYKRTPLLHKAYLK